MPSVVFAQDAVEGVFSIKYYKFERDVIVLFKDDQVYLPILEIMSFLKIYNEYNNTAQIITGYVGSEDKVFYANFVNGEISSTDQMLSYIDTDSLIVSELDIYVRPDILSKIFGFEIVVSYYDLKALIRTEIDLPAKEDYMRQFKDEKENNYFQEKEFAPLMFERDLRIIDGGILNYRFGSYNSDNYSTYSFNGDLGLQLLGGDLNISSFYNYNNQSHLQYQYQRYRWELPFNENPYISELTIGNVTSNSLNFGSFGSIRNKYSALKGVSVSNRSYRNSQVFSTFLFDDYAEPFSQVELYINKRLVNAEKIGADGYYKFDIPLAYGNSLVETKIYAPNGMRTFKEETIQIPGALLKPGEIKYSFSAGEDENYKQTIADGMAEVGITDFLSFGFSDLINLSNTENVFVSNLNARILAGLTGGLSVSMDNFYRAMLGFSHKEYGSYELGYTKYDQNAVLNNFRLDEELEFRAYLPKSQWMPISLRVRTELARRDVYYVGTYKINTNANIWGLKFAADYNMNHSFEGEYTSKLMQNLSTRLAYSFKLPFITNSSLRSSLRLNGVYNISTSKLVTFGASFSQRILRDLSLNLSWTNDIQTKISYSNISLNYCVPFMRFGSRAYVSEDRNDVDSFAEGSLGIDTKMPAVHFSRNKSYNGSSGSASVRCFIDANGNMSYDENERLLPGVKVRVPQGRVMGDNTTEVKVVSNLRPGYRYNLHLDLSSAENPLIRPLWNEFSFIADPNTFKSIDIPFTVAGLIEGQVYSEDSTGSRVGKSGIKIHLIRKETGEDISVNVFSDGSFYHLGLIPGYYEVFVDKTQLGLLKMQTDPPIQELYIGFSEDGDMKSGIDFKLIPEKKEPGGAVSPSSE